MTQSSDSNPTDKRVLTADGEQIGTVVRVEAGTMHVRPTDRLTDRLSERLGWTNGGEYTLDPVAVDRTTSDTVVLRPEFSRSFRGESS